MKWFFVAFAMALPTTAWAQRASGDSKPRSVTNDRAADTTRGADNERVVFKKRTIIDFTGALIEGDLIKPEGSYVVSRKVSRFSSLIRVRENYLPELIASPNDL